MAKTSNSTDASTVVDKAQVRALISSKKAQIAIFNEAKEFPEKQRSFSKAEYEQKVKDLEADIEGLEVEL